MRIFTFALVLFVFVTTFVVSASAQTADAAPAATPAAVSTPADPLYYPGGTNPAWGRLSAVMFGVAVVAAIIMAIGVLNTEHGAFCMIGWIIMFILGHFVTEVLGGHQGQWDVIHIVLTMLGGLLTMYLGLRLGFVADEVFAKKSRKRRPPTLALAFSI